MTLATLPLAAGAAGMGRIAVISALGQPLRAEIELTANSDELASLSARIAPVDAYKRAGIEFSSALPNIRFSVEKRSNGQPYLSMRSDQAFSEPFLDVLVEMTWASGRMVREYTFLLDPPDSKTKPATQAAPVTLPVAPVQETKKESPAAPAAPVTTPQPAAPAIPASPKAGDEMKVVRGADGVQRIVKTSPSADKSPQHQATHTVKRGETLHRIAVETKPEGVSLDQMLVALFRSNPDAFDHGNIHRLRAGKILNIPDQEAAAAIDPAEAHEVVMAQSSDFNAYRKKLAASVAGAHAEAEEAPKQAASGKIAPQVKDHAPSPTAGKDKLEISKSEVAKGKGGKEDAAGRIGAAALEEELLARDNALKEANARIAELDKNIKDLRNLVEMKNQGMADLQHHAQTPPPAQSPVPPSQDTAAAPGKTAEPVAEKPAEPPKPAPEVKKTPPPPPPEPEPEPDFIQDNPGLLAGGAGILTLLLGYLGYARWRKKKQEAELDAMGSMSVAEETPSASQFASSGGQIVDTGSTENNSLQTDFSLAGGGIAGPSEGVDPIAEADVYMAYGRTAQAEEILLDALKNEPTRQEIHLKLLEIYAASKSVKQYETIAVDLHQLTHAAGPAWDKAARQGRQLDPQNPLYSDKPAPQDEFDPAATMMLTPQDLGKMHEEEPENEMMQTAIMEQPVEPVQEGGDKEIVPESLDFDLDLGSDTPAVPAAETPAEPAPEAVAAATDFDFDLGTPEAEPVAEAPAQAASEAPAAGGDVDFDFDLGDEGKEATVAAPEAAASPAAESNEVEFDLDLTAPEPSSAEGDGEAASMLEEIKLPETGSTTATGSDPDFDFDLGSNAETPAAEQSAVLSPLASGVDLSSISLELDEVKTPATDTEAIDLGIDLSDAAAPAAEPVAAVEEEPDLPEVTTKLELAQAYEEMGDKDGARELLEEVLKEGGARQKALARDKLALLG